MSFGGGVHILSAVIGWVVWPAKCPCNLFPRFFSGTDEEGKKGIDGESGNRGSPGKQHWWLVWRLWYWYWWADVQWVRSYLSWCGQTANVEGMRSFPSWWGQRANVEWVESYLSWWGKRADVDGMRSCPSWWGQRANVEWMGSYHSWWGQRSNVEGMRSFPSGSGPLSDPHDWAHEKKLLLGLNGQLADPGSEDWGFVWKMAVVACVTSTVRASESRCGGNEVFPGSREGFPWLGTWKHCSLGVNGQLDDPGSQELRVRLDNGSGSVWVVAASERWCRGSKVFTVMTSSEWWVILMVGHTKTWLLGVSGQLSDPGSSGEWLLNRWTCVCVRLCFSACVVCVHGTSYGSLLLICVTSALESAHQFILPALSQSF